MMSDTKSFAQASRISISESSGIGQGDPLAAGEAERRHQTARLGLLGIGQPFPQVIFRVGNHPGGECPPAHQMRQVGCVSPLGGRAAYAVAVHARLRQEHVSACARGCFVIGWLLLVLQPRSESPRGNRRQLAKAYGRAACRSTRHIGRETIPAGLFETTYDSCVPGSDRSSRPVAAPRSCGRHRRTEA